jgi:spore coat protein U-like protein
MIRRLAIAVAFVALATAPSFAANNPPGVSPQTKQFTAQVQVNGNCTITALPTLDFATYDPLTANASAEQPGTTHIDLKCTRGSHPLISLDKGGNAAGNQRTMITGAGGTNNFLNYGLFQADSSGVCASTNTAWGDGTALGAKLDVGVTNVPPSQVISNKICGFIPPGQDANAGAYTDTVTASVEF